MGELVDLIIRGKRSFKGLLSDDFWKISEAPCFWFGMTHEQVQERIERTQLEQYNLVSCSLDMKADFLLAIKNRTIRCRLINGDLYINPIHFIQWGMIWLQKTDSGISIKFLNNLPLVLLDFLLCQYDPLEILKTLRKGTQEYHRVHVISTSRDLCLLMMDEQGLEEPPNEGIIKNHPIMKSLLVQIDREKVFSKRFKELFESHIRNIKKPIWNRMLKDLQSSKGYSVSTKYEWIREGRKLIYKRSVGRPSKSKTI